MSPLYALAPVGFNSSAVSCDCLAHVHGNAADHPDRERRYPSDMTDAEWAVVRPLLPMPAWMEGRGGQPEKYCHRQMLDAIRYLVDGGIKWRSMPADFPGWKRVYAFFSRWQDNKLVKVSATAEIGFWITFRARATEGHRRVDSGTAVSGRGGHACAGGPRRPARTSAS